MDTRILGEADDSLSDASIGKIISTGIVLGIVHVLTGPDHLSALAAMTASTSWRAFWLGCQWGIGHSVGLIIMAVIFFAAGQAIDIDEVGKYFNYIIGVFMIALGIWSGVHARKKYVDTCKDVQNCENLSGSRRLQSLRRTEPPATSQSPILSPVVDEPSSTLPQEEHRSPMPSSNHIDQDVIDLSQKSESLEAASWLQRCRAKCTYTNPVVQRLMALAVGIVHGFAGPGGILGVLPAVVLDDWGRSLAYLGSFCISSIFIMGVFAAIYGEVTGRLGRQSPRWELHLGIVSGCFSILVGVAWIILQATGTMDQVFH